MAAESNEAPILGLLAKMTADSIEATGLDPQTLMLRPNRRPGFG